MNPSDHWPLIKETGTLIGIRIIIFSYLLGGFTLSRVFLFPVLLYYFLFKPDFRKTSREYFERVSKKADHLPEINLLLSFRHLWQFGSSLIDKFAVWRGDIQHDQVNIYGSKLFDELLLNKQGGVIAITHLGNFEVCSALLRSHPEFRLTILNHIEHAEKFNFLLNKYKIMSNIDELQVTNIDPSMAMKLSERVGRGEFVAIAADRLPVNNPEASVTCNFFNQPADFPIGPYVLANILRVPLLLLICVKHKKQYRIYFEKITDGGKISKDERIDFTNKAVKVFAERLEDYTCRYPLQWFNFFNFWKKTNSSNKNFIEDEI